MIHVKHLRRRWLFALVDFAVVSLSIYLAIRFRQSWDTPFFTGILDYNPLSNPLRLVGAGVFLGTVYASSQYILGVYDTWTTSSGLMWARKIFVPNVLLVAVAFSLLYMSQKFDFPRSLLVSFFPINYGISCLWRVIYFRAVDREVSDVVLVGDLVEAVQVAKEFDIPPFRGKVRVRAIFVPAGTDLRAKTEEGISILALNSFQEFSQTHPYTSVIVVPSKYRQDMVFSEVLKAAHRKVPVYTMPTPYEILLGRLKHIQVNDLPLLELKLEPPTPAFMTIKRFFDVVLSSILLIIFAIPMAFVAMLVKTTSPGPIFYRQARVGMNGRVFSIIKFRSMVENAELETGAVLATKNDPRVTPLGAFMRVTRIDELPQLWNILKGDMSLVGPRPERPVFVEKLEQTIPAYRERKRIRPGVTGLAQVSGRYDSSPETKLKYDLAYMANQGILLDVQILLKTAKTVMTRAGQ